MAKFVSDKIRKKSAARLAGVQAVYLIDFGGADVDSIVQDFVDGKIGRFALEGGEMAGESEEAVELPDLDRAYFITLARGVAGKKEELERSLSGYLAEPWRLDKMDGVLKALLLCAVFELVYNRDVDTKVIIKEYVDLAYAFFFKNEPKMVNALLDQVAKAVRQ